MSKTYRLCQLSLRVKKPNPLKFNRKDAILHPHHHPHHLLEKQKRRDETRKLDEDLSNGEARVLTPGMGRPGSLTLLGSSVLYEDKEGRETGKGKGRGEREIDRETTREIGRGHVVGYMEL